MTDRVRDWWNSTRIYDYVPWNRRRHRVRPNARRWPPFHCNDFEFVCVCFFFFQSLQSALLIYVRVFL